MINSIKDYHKEQQLHRNRVTTALVFILLSFVSLLVHLFNLQVIEYDKYNTFSKNNRINVLPIPPNRGLIYDRNGLLITENRPIHELEVNLRQIKNLKETIEDLNKIIPISEEDKQRFYELLKRGYKRTGIPIKTNLTHEEMAKFAVNRHNFPGVEMTAKLIRYYPYKEELAHVLGYIGRINEQKGALRAAAHEDINLITLLPASSQMGLQVKTKENNWIDVGSNKGEIIVNMLYLFCQL